MIKKAVLLTLTAPFLMVFSDYSFAQAVNDMSDTTISLDEANNLPGVKFSDSAQYASSADNNRRYVINRVRERVSSYCATRDCVSVAYGSSFDSSDRSRFRFVGSVSTTVVYDIPSNMNYGLRSDDVCQSENGDSYSTNNPDVYNYLSAGGVVKTHSGACSVSASGGVDGCFGSGDDLQCLVSITSESTGSIGDFGQHIAGSLGSSSDGTFSVVDFSGNDYLTELPGGCSDNASCVSIGDKSYLVDWDSAPDYFQYIGSDGNIYSKPSSGGGSGGDNGGDTGGGDPTDPTTPTDPTDPGGNDGGDSGGNSGGSDGGNDSGDGSGGSSGGGGSTVPEFEFDESGIIEAIRSSGQSNQNALEAVSNDLSGAINSQSEGISEGLEALGEGFGDAIGEQTEEVQGMFDGLGNTITNALGLGTCYPDGQQTDDGHTAATNDKGLLGCIQNIANGMVDNLVGRLTEEVGEGNDLLNTSGMDETLDGLEEERQLYNEEVNTFMDEIGDGSSSGIAEQVTSRLPSLPSRSCTPIQFGQMQISCQATNTAKLWLTWIVYFWTVVSVVDTFFRSGQRTA
ncbi:hypothetical protein RVM26_11930 [Halomonas sp. KM072]